MKGFIFTEFLEMVEETFSLEMVDQLMLNLDLPSGGVYTAVGTYEHNEIVQLVSELSKLTEIPTDLLIHAFGVRLFSVLVERYDYLITNISNPFSFLERLEDYIHADIRKLYPEAQVPTFSCEYDLDGYMHMVYRSEHFMPDLAHGLIEGCFIHYNQDVLIERENRSNEAGKAVEFIIQPAPELEVNV